MRGCSAASQGEEGPHFAEEAVEIVEAVELGDGALEPPSQFVAGFEEALLARQEPSLADLFESDGAVDVAGFESRCQERVFEFGHIGDLFDDQAEFTPAFVRRARVVVDPIGSLEIVSASDVSVGIDQEMPASPKTLATRAAISRSREVGCRVGA